MCGIAGLIHKGKQSNVGSQMTSMLQALKHRGPDSTGYAVYSEGKDDEFVMRVKVAEADDMSSGRGIYAGGQDYGGSYTSRDTAQYYTISTPGSASAYGDLTAAGRQQTGMSNGTFLLIAGGGGYETTIEYYTIATTADAQSWGSLCCGPSGGRYSAAGCADATRGIFAGGSGPDGQSGPFTNRIQYLSMESTGNASDFGDLTVARQGGGQMSSNTRGVHFGGGTQSSPYNTDVIDYITIANTGNATDFGDVAAGQSRDVQSCSNLTRGVCAVQYVGSSNASGLEYVTIASTGNASSFGSLSTGTYNQDGRRSVSGGSVEDRGLWYMGGPSSAWVKDIEYVTISTTGNSTDFGDTLYPGRQPQGCSGPVS